MTSWNRNGLITREENQLSLIAEWSNKCLHIAVDVSVQPGLDSLQVTWPHVLGRINSEPLDTDAELR